MAELELQVPTIKHKDNAEKLKREFFDNHEIVINGSALLDQMEYEQWLSKQCIFNAIRRSHWLCG
jgi:predicted acetyltransferase